MIAFGLAFVLATPAGAEVVDSPQTVKAYSIDVEGREYLQEGYVEQQVWQEDFNAKAEQAEKLNAELIELTQFLDDESAAKVNDFDVSKFKYIKEVDSYIADAEKMKQDALAAKERQLEQQRRIQQAQQAQRQQTQSSVPNGSGLTRSGGVNWYNGRKETYYSSRVLYHYRTSEWWIDSEGFYRTSEGYYVVAASDMAQGTVFRGSKGLCQVLDSGCAANVTDYYVQW